MAEPLSFVASVIAVSGLAGTVATKGYRYLKVAKNCSEEVRRLIAEVNALYGILERLVELLPGSKANSDATNPAVAHARKNIEHESPEQEESDSSYESEDELNLSSNALEPPDFIYECRKTLSEIEDILNKFGRTNSQSLHSGDKSRKSRFRLSVLRRLEPKDLKWPLSRSDTMQLFEALERHKSTCTIALARDGLMGIYTVLEQTKLSNRHLADLRAKQQKMFELCINQEEEKALAWLSPVEPASKLHNFREERHSGTGIWLFDRPEMAQWLENPNSALWIYGIPGAGKTILSTLVVDEVLIRKRSASVGTAYFYVRYDDPESHILKNVFGSLIAQLARQNRSALEDVMEMYSDCHGPLRKAFRDHELKEMYIRVSRHFAETFVMIDGLDECGTALDLNRKRLVTAVAKLHGNNESPIRVLILSRDEHDIREQFHLVGFSTVSIAATSADLRLYASAWLPSLGIRSKDLKAEIVDTLVEEANGMFMWVRAQLDYMQRLPNDFEKKKALRRLPPDLPQTYIRILETIGNTYASQSTKYIQRALKWLVLGERCRWYIGTADCSLTPAALCQAICIENANEWPPDDIVPTVEQLFAWLGCLVRVKTEMGKPQLSLSHFTIREFLTTEPVKVTSAVAQGFLIKPRDTNYILKSCLTCLMHDHFKGIKWSTCEEIDTFLSEYPLYGYIAINISDRLSSSNGHEADDSERALMREFFSMPSCPAFTKWDTCATYINELQYTPMGDGLDFDCLQSLATPLHMACVLDLPNEVQNILREGVDPDLASNVDKLQVSTLSLSICSSNRVDVETFQGRLRVTSDDDQIMKLKDLKDSSLQVTELLVEFGAKINQHLIVNIESEHLDASFTPLTLALFCYNPVLANLLLNKGAILDMVAEKKKTLDLCSIQSLLNKRPKYETTVQRLVDLATYPGLERALEQWRKIRDTADCDSSSKPGCENDNADPQALFVDAFSNKNWQKAQQLLLDHPEVEVNCYDDKGTNAIHYATSSTSNHAVDALLFLLEHGADPNSKDPTGSTALSRAASRGCLESIRLLLKFGANIEHQGPRGSTPFLGAVANRHVEAMELLLDAKANLNAVYDDGTSALLKAFENEDAAMASSLMKVGIDSSLPDNYGTTPLHDACAGEFEHAVRELLTQSSVLKYNLNAESMDLGTPLYAATLSGSHGIARILLDHGAQIDKGGPSSLGSPLMAACANDRRETVRLLLSRGAALEVEGARFGSAAGTARAFRKQQILKILEEHEKTPVQDEKDDAVHETLAENERAPLIQEEEEPVHESLTAHEKTPIQEENQSVHESITEHGRTRIQEEDPKGAI